MIDHSEVTAIVVTRGDVDLDPILETLPFDDLIIWDNSERGEDAKCHGRYLAAEEALHDVVYFQDDDLIFRNVDALLAAYEPGRITCNMPSPWYERTNYDTLGCGLVGAGSLVPRGLWQTAFDRYLEHYPKDDLFLTYCDQVFGILTPYERLDLGYEILDYALAPGRICTSDGAHEAKTLIQGRAVALRDG